MKKFLIFAILIFAFVGLQAQRGSGTVLKQKMSAVTVNGAGDTDYTIFPTVQGEYDLSLQMIPAKYGAGDSIYFSYRLYLSDSDGDDVWTVVSDADTVTSTTDYDALVTFTDFKSLRVKAIYTGIGADSVTITPYCVYKKHSNE
jgi:hypothetical protein